MLWVIPGQWFYSNPMKNKTDRNSYIERFARWQQTTITQLGHVNNLFLSYSIGALGFMIAKVGAPNSDTLKHIYWILLISIILGSLLTISRLFDFRYTTQTIKKEKELYRLNNSIFDEIKDICTENSVTIQALCHEIKCLRYTTKFLGKLTWILFFFQITTFTLSIFFVVQYFQLI